MTPVAMPKKIKSRKPPLRQRAWASFRQPETEPAEEPLELPQRGPLAVQHNGSTSARGRRSERFPDIHITRTAKLLGITKAHLGKVLAGTSRPSYSLLLKLADVLGKDLNYVGRLIGPHPQEKKPHAKSNNRKRRRSASHPAR